LILASNVGDYLAEAGAVARQSFMEPYQIKTNKNDLLK
jgi:hypothetical protein